jgi:hypothetical protein
LTEIPPDKFPVSIYLVERAQTNVDPEEKILHIRKGNDNENENNRILGSALHEHTAES